MSVTPWNPPAFDKRISHKLEGAEVPAAVALPSLEELEALRAKAYQEAFTRGLQDGMVTGQEQGQRLGREDGFEQGRVQGFEQGYQQGYADGQLLAQQAASSLRNVLDCLEAIPNTLQEDLAQWVYEVATRVSDDPTSRKQAIMKAVTEALGTLPPPEEGIRITVPAAEWDSWHTLLNTGDWPYLVILKKDAQINAGHAYVELSGARMDIGVEARRALVRTAMGLLPPSTGQ